MSTVGNIWTKWYVLLAYLWMAGKLTGDGQTRQKGGIGSAAHDPKQQDIRAFFGGGKPKGETVTDVEEGRSESNARDEADVDIQ